MYIISDLNKCEENFYVSQKLKVIDNCFPKVNSRITPNILDYLENIL